MLGLGKKKPAQQQQTQLMVKGDTNVGKTYILRDTMTGHAYELDQYPSWERNRQGAARWIIHERYGDMMGKFMTRKGALNFLKKESESKLRKVF